MKACETVGEYMEGLPDGVRAEFALLWQAVRELVPGGEEVIRYGMPTMRVAGKNLVHCAAMKEHLGFYPTPSGVKAFESELSGKYSYSKGAIRFPLDQRLPLPLIRKIVHFRLAEESSRLPESLEIPPSKKVT